MAKFLRIGRLLMDHDGISLDSNLKYKNIIICYYLLTILSFNTHRSPMRWLLLLSTFYYERSTKKGFKKVHCPFITAKNSQELKLYSPHISLCLLHQQLDTEAPKRLPSKEHSFLNPTDQAQQLFHINKLFQMVKDLRMLTFSNTENEERWFLPFSVEHES